MSQIDPDTAEKIKILEKKVANLEKLIEMCASCQIVDKNFKKNNEYIEKIYKYLEQVEIRLQIVEKRQY